MKELDIDKIGFTGEAAQDIPDSDKQIMYLALLWVRFGYNKALEQVVNKCMEPEVPSKDLFDIAELCNNKMGTLQSMDSAELGQFFDEVRRDILKEFPEMGEQLNNQ